MTNFAVSINFLFSVLTIGAQIFALIIILSLIFREHYFSKKILPLIKHYAFIWGFVVALGATLGSLIYSDIIGFDPCSLCWFQRAFMYPQVLLLGMAIWRRDHNIVDYSLWFSIVGGLIALYQAYTQLGGFSFTDCTAVGSTCAKVFFIEFGYVTIPVMSFTAFLLIALFMIVKKVYREQN